MSEELKPCADLIERLQKAEHHFRNANEGEYYANLFQQARFALEDAARATPSEDDVERAAKAIFEAPEPLSGDMVGDLIYASDMLFPSEEHLRGRNTAEACKLAAMDVCRTAARAALEGVKR